MTATVDQNSVNLIWETLDGTSVYAVCLAKVTIPSVAQCSELNGGRLVAATVNNMKISNLDSGATYFIRVRAKRSDGSNGIDSDEISFSINSQKEGAFEVFDNGVTDLSEVSSYILRDQNYIYIGTKNGKLISVNAKTLEPINKILIKTTDFLHIDAVVDYIYQNGERLYVALTVESYKENVKHYDTYIVQYQLNNGFIGEMVNYLKTSEDTANYNLPVTGLYQFKNKLYVSTERSLTSYDLSISPIYKGVDVFTLNDASVGGATGFCGTQNKVFALVSGNVIGYDIDTGHYIRKNEIVSNSLYCNDGLIFTDKGVFDTNLDMKVTFDSEKIDFSNGVLKSLSFFDKRASIYQYYKTTNVFGYVNDCRIRSIEINLNDFSVNYDDHSFYPPDYTYHCPHETFQSGMYKIENGFSNVLNGSSYIHRVLNSDEQLKLKSIYNLNGLYQDHDSYNGFIYTLFSNKLIMIDDEKKTYQVLREIKTTDTYDFSSLSIAGGKLVVSQARGSLPESDPNNIIVYTINEDGSLIDYGSLSGQARTGGFVSSGANILACDNKIFLPVSAYNDFNSAYMDDVVVIDINTLQYDATTWHGSLYSLIRLSELPICLNNKPFVINFRSEELGVRALYLNENNAWAISETTHPLSSYPDTFLWNFENKYTFLDANKKLRMIDFATYAQNDAILGFDTPFVATNDYTGGIYTYSFYDSTGNVSKKIESHQCSYNSDINDMPYIKGNRLWTKSYNSYGSTLCSIPIN